MEPALVVDGAVVIAVVVAVASGWRQGGFASILASSGIIAGLVVGIGLAPMVLGLTDNVGLRMLLAIGLLVLLVGLGQLLGGSIGHAVRDRMRRRSTQRLDSLIGSAFTSIAALVIIWMITMPLATGIPGPVGQGLRESRVLRTVHQAMPESVAQLPQSISGLLNQSGLPPIINPWDTGFGNVDVAEPNIQVADEHLVKSMRPSIVQVVGDSDSCRRRLMGSGFVTQPDYVVTNAHVVAGTQKVYVDTVLGIREADVVYYNSDIDIAVLHSPDLGLNPLPWAQETANTGDDAIILGFPESGPFTASPARIRDRITIAGPDIYSQGRVERDSYTLRGTVVHGNSGGPLANEHGEIIGLIFGASVSDSETGYALTAQEVLSHLPDIPTLNEAVTTGQCVAI
ncbi:MAG: MarP family serine protease [Corynebacterium sp.]|nr:MarP family serine protease [Corynebacterium sp.]